MWGTDDQSPRWNTPTGDPCPRSVGWDGSIVGTGDCHGCGFCLLIAGLVEPSWRAGSMTVTEAANAALLTAGRTAA
jgi:hypothetical protein